MISGNTTKTLSNIKGNNKYNDDNDVESQWWEVREIPLKIDDFMYLCCNLAAGDFASTVVNEVMCQ